MRQEEFKEAIKGNIPKESVNDLFNIIEDFLKNKFGEVSIYPKSNNVFKVNCGSLCDNIISVYVKCIKIDKLKFPEEKRVQGIDT